MVIFNSLLNLRLSVFQKPALCIGKTTISFTWAFLFLSVKNWNSDSLVNRTHVAKGNLKWWRQQFSIIANISTLLAEVCSWEIKQKVLASWKSKDRNYGHYQVGTETTDRFPDSGNCTCYELMPLLVKTYSPLRFRQLTHERNWVLALQTVIETPKNEDYLYSTSFSHSVHILTLAIGHQFFFLGNYSFFQQPG